MGNDGGSIPKRRELVKEAAKALTTAQLKEAQTEQQEYSWTTDPLTRKPLARPVVSDAAGVLYNKDSIIEFLLKDDADAQKVEMRKVAGVKGTVEGGFAELGTFGDRVKGLKDVVEVQFEIAQGEGERARGEQWVCPITGTVLGPGSKAVYIVPCGHAFAGSVVKEVAGSACLTCNEPFAENDIIPINPYLPTDLARLNLRATTLREKSLTHALKKAPGSKKRKKTTDKEKESTSNTIKPTTHTTTTTTNNNTATTATQPPSTSSDEDLQTPNKDKANDKKPAQPNSSASTSASSSLQNTATASLTRKVLHEQEQANKRRRLAQNDNVNSLFNTSDYKPRLGNSADYMTRGFSLGKK